jgi:hypothetical protein
MEKDVKKIIEKVDRKFVRTYSGRKMKRIRISLLYHKEMKTSE